MDKYVSVFGDRFVKKFDFTLRSTITITRELTLQWYGQLFSALGSYSNYRILNSPDKFSYYDGFFEKKINRKYLNSNFVIRWEYINGSTIYLVWTQNRNYDIDNQFFQEYELPEDIFGIQPTNIFLLKISYWWNL